MVLALISLVVAVVAVAHVWIASDTPEAHSAGSAEPGTTASVPAISRAFRFTGEAGTSTRVVLNDLGVRIAAGCDSNGRLKVRMRLLAPGQLQSASTDTRNKDATAFNEVRHIYKRQPSAVSILPARTDNQIGHTEIFTGAAGVASVHWQADNPSLRYDLNLPGEQAEHRCAFSGTVVGIP